MEIQFMESKKLNNHFIFSDEVLDNIHMFLLLPSFSSFHLLVAGFDFHCREVDITNFLALLNNPYGETGLSASGWCVYPGSLVYPVVSCPKTSTYGVAAIQQGEVCSDFIMNLNCTYSHVNLKYVNFNVNLKYANFIVNLKYLLRIGGYYALIGDNTFVSVWIYLKIDFVFLSIKSQNSVEAASVPSRTAYGLQEVI
ncbi:hypothetical protein LXL04_027475 [Taraxacum kok-saghyz]